MATGRSNQLTKQVGEYRVAAELCRRGLVATTFTGSVPDYDIVAVAETGDSVLVQVKSVWGGSWQLGNARVFLDIKQDGKRQIPGRRKKPKYPDLIYVFVLLDRDGADRFFLIKAIDLHSMIAAGYQRYMKHMGGVRPKNNESYHWGLTPSTLAKFEDRWDLVTTPT